MTQKQAKHLALDHYIVKKLFLKKKQKKIFAHKSSNIINTINIQKNDWIVTINLFIQEEHDISKFWKSLWCIFKNVVISITIVLYYTYGFDNQFYQSGN